MSCEQRPGEVVSRRLRSQFASRHQAAPGIEAARLVERAGTRTTAHRRGRVKQGGCFSSGGLRPQRHNARSLVMRERGLLETRAID